MRGKPFPCYLLLPRELPPTSPHAFFLSSFPDLGSSFHGRERTAKEVVEMAKRTVAAALLHHGTLGFVVACLYLNAHPFDV